MKCERAERLLPLLGRGDLNEKDARALQDHLVDCALCAESARDYEAFFNLLHSTGGVDFDEEFFGRVRRSVLSEIRLRDRRPPPPLQWWRAIPAAVRATGICAGVSFRSGTALLYKPRPTLREATVAAPAEEVPR